MGFVDWFRRRTVRYAVIITLVGTLAATCRKELPKEQSLPISATAAQIQEDLRNGSFSEQQIGEFARKIVQAEQQFGISIKLPKNLHNAVLSLHSFYEDLDNAKRENRLEQDYKWAKEAYARILRMKIELMIAEANLKSELTGEFKLTTERTELSDYIVEVIQSIENQAEAMKETIPVLKTIRKEKGKFTKVYMSPDQLLLKLGEIQNELAEK